MLDGEIKIERDKFLKLAALGVNVFVSSGDGGSIRISSDNWRATANGMDGLVPVRRRGGWYATSS